MRRTGDAITFKVQDDGGVGFGGVDTDPADKTVSITVSGGANHEPAGTNQAVNASEDIAYQFKLADFPFNDGDQNPPGTNTQALQAVKVSSLPALGSLTLVGGPNNGAVERRPVHPGLGHRRRQVPLPGEPQCQRRSYASFTFQVQDNGGTAVVLGTQGVDLDSTPNTETINVLAVNDPPSGSDRSIAASKMRPTSSAGTDFSFTDPLDSPANGFIKLRISSVPTSGSLTLAGVPVTVGQLVDVINDIDGGALQFTPALNTNGAANLPSSQFQVQDDGGTANGGQDTRSIAQHDHGQRDRQERSAGRHQRPDRDAWKTTTTSSRPTTSASPIRSDQKPPSTLSTDPNTLAACGSRRSPSPRRARSPLGGSPLTVGQLVSAAAITSGSLQVPRQPEPVWAGPGQLHLPAAGQRRHGQRRRRSGIAAMPNTITVNVANVNDPPQCAR